MIVPEDTLLDWRNLMEAIYGLELPLEIEMMPSTSESYFKIFSRGKNCKNSLI